MISGDLGGTNGRLQLWVFTDSNPILQFNANYRILEYVDLVELLKRFVKDSGFNAQKVGSCSAFLFMSSRVASWRFVGHLWAYIGRWR
jgi:glucokinase